MPAQMRLLVLIPLSDDLIFEDGRGGGWAISSGLEYSTLFSALVFTGIFIYNINLYKSKKNIYCGAQIIIFT